MQNMLNLASFWKPEACGQTVLPDRSVLIGQKFEENAKIDNFKWDILSNLQALWPHSIWKWLENVSYQISQQVLGT